MSDPYPVQLSEWTVREYVSVTISPACPICGLKKPKSGDTHIKQNIYLSIDPDDLPTQGFMTRNCSTCRRRYRFAWKVDKGRRVEIETRDYEPSETGPKALARRIAELESELGALKKGKK